MVVKAELMGDIAERILANDMSGMMISDANARSKKIRSVSECNSDQFGDGVQKYRDILYRVSEVYFILEEKGLLAK